ncbi:SCO3933 family regulatory protein [Actinospica acidithermotolerans]
MRVIPVDWGRLCNVLCTAAPEVRSDFTTGEVRTDRESGKPLYLVGVLVKVEGDRRAAVLDVEVAGEPVGLVEGEPVVLDRLEARPWEREGRSGVTYRAESITPARATTPPATATATAADSAGPGRSSGKGGAS